MIIFPLAQCLKNHNFEFFSINSTTSTMDDAKLKINSLNKNLIVISNKQTKGRGRRGNKWVSQPGNIYCSIALLIDIPNDKLFKLAILTSVAIKNSLKHIGLVDILFKWPNDVFCCDKKIAGIIQETYLNKVEEQIIIIGVGINYLSSPLSNTYKTTFIKEYVKDISREQYIEIFFNYFFKYFDEFLLNNNDFFVNEYKKLQMFLNKKIKIQVDKNKIIKGHYMGINKDGSLMLMKNNKKLSIYSGQILL